MTTQITFSPQVSTSIALDDQQLSVDVVASSTQTVTVIGIGGIGNGSAAATIAATASEALAAASLVNLWSDAGTAKARQADSVLEREAHGYTAAAVTQGDTATVALSGVLTGLSGLTPGARMYLSTAGAVTATATNSAGQLSQLVGIATSATEVAFDPEDPIYLI